MKVTLTSRGCKIIKETGDKKFYSEGTFLHHIKTELQKQGYDVIKKNMSKDGHMVSDSENYIRSRKLTDDKGFMIYCGDYQIRKNFEDFNNRGEVTFSVDGTVSQSSSKDHRTITVRQRESRKHHSHHSKYGHHETGLITPR